MSMLSLRDLHVTYRSEGGDVSAVRGVTLDVAPGQFYTLLGPSGSGKSTILRAIAGLERPTAGEIRIGTDVVYSSQRGIHVPAHRRRVAMVFQSYAIWPHMDVYSNVAFPLLHGQRRYPEPEVRRRVQQLLEMVKLDKFAKRPAALLSGGEQQRVALARALAAEPAVLLLDEPLSNLDAGLRLEMRREIRRLVKDLGITTVYVTHDQEEAFALSDRIAVLKDGVVMQDSDPKELYLRPRTAFVGRFVGNANLLPGVVTRIQGDGSDYRVGVATSVGNMHGFSVSRLDRGASVFVAIRPDVFLPPGWVNGKAGDLKNSLRGRVQESVFTGGTTEIQLDIGDGLSIRVRWPGYHDLHVGDELHVEVPATVCSVVLRDPHDQ